MVVISASVASGQTVAPAAAPIFETTSPTLNVSAISVPSVDGATSQPSSIPSDLPSDMPSLAPSAEPTLELQSFASERFRQEFKVENGRLFSEYEEILFQGLYGSYTEDFAPQESRTVDGRIFTSCEFLSQSFVARRLAFASGRSYGIRARRLQNASVIAVDFSMQYTSLYSDVTTYPTLFQLHVNSNLEKIAEQMQLLGLNASEALIASRIVIRPDPTTKPTAVPTLKPSQSTTPSMMPSDFPSLPPSSEDLPATESPSESPSVVAQKRIPGSDVTVISVSVVLAIAIVIVGLSVYKKKKNDRHQAPTLNKSKLRNDSNGIPHQDQPYEIFAHPSGDHVASLGIAASPSLLSNHSLLSADNSIGGGSRDEVDATQNLADEFDQYKDQNLEKMRAGVEGNLMGFDGMMSQALTRALIDEDETNLDPTELLWGASGHLIGMEVEASALGEVTEWLKRNKTPSDDERYVKIHFYAVIVTRFVIRIVFNASPSQHVRRLFMQEALNKMVTSVRHGVLGPEEASRSIHECAALLGLQLATEIPVTTLIITGMRKTVTADDMLDAFAEFGEVLEAAVASNQRGFGECRLYTSASYPLPPRKRRNLTRLLFCHVVTGILRFKSNQSVDLAMSRFRTEEIVVQDVAVQVKVLRPGGNNSIPDDDEVLQTGILAGLPS